MRPFCLSLRFFGFFLLWSCGGGDEVSESSDDPVVEESAAPETEQSTELEPADSVAVEEEAVEAKEAPDPNGVFLPLYEDKGGKLEVVKMNERPVYSNGAGYFLWSNGSLWKISTKAGGGRTISTGGEKISDAWEGGAKTRFSEDEEYTKQAMFRLAVAFQGSEDNANAIRLFSQFVTLFPDDKLVAEVYLSMGDLATSGLGPDTQPTFEQIQLARSNYAKVRQNTKEIGLISDSTANEGGLIERVAENPEGLVNHFFTFDKDNDKMLSVAEAKSLSASLEGAYLFVFEDHDLSGDGSLGFEELFEAASISCYKELESLYESYMKSYGDTEGAQVAKATEKIGFAKEKLGQPSEMLKIYFQDIRRFGNDPNNLGVDGILAAYCEKYQHYEALFGQTVDLLEKLQNPSEPVSFTHTDRKGIEKEISGTIREMVEDRSKSLAMLSTLYKNMDPKVYGEVVKFRGGVFANPKYVDLFKGYLKKYRDLQSAFPKDLAPSKAFVQLLQDAQSDGSKTLELRMRANLDRVGSKIGSDYNPQTSDFPAASAGVLVWMAKKMLKQNSLEDAVSAMERLIGSFGGAGGETLFDAHYVIGQAREKQRDFAQAAASFDAAITNSPWHADANDARIRKGYALFEVAKAEKDEDGLMQAQSAFGEARDNEDAPMVVKAECSFMMGECLKAKGNHLGAAFHYEETTLFFAGSGKWAQKSFEQAIASYERAGQSEKVRKLEQNYTDWQRNFLQ